MGVGSVWVGGDKIVRACFLSLGSFLWGSSVRGEGLCLWGEKCVFSCLLSGGVVDVVWWRLAGARSLCAVCDSLCGFHDSFPLMVV